jgi:hypothetical protein
VSNLSRPYQIALVAVLLLGGVWLFALRGHSSSSSSSSSSASTPSPSTPTLAPSNASAPSPAPASGPTLPGVKGLTSAIAKAHGAVATSQANAASLQRQSAAASSNGPVATSAPSAAAATSASAAPAHPAVSAPSPVASHVVSGDLSTPLLAQMHAGKVVVLLFYNPRASDDQEVNRAVHIMSRRDGHVFLAVANGAQVADYGAITRGVQVQGTPTVLVIDRRGEATTLTGLRDARDVQQSVGDAVRAAEQA